MVDITFLDLADVIGIHNDQIMEYGGQADLRNFRLMHSAMEMPSASFGGEWLHRDIFEMAAAYAFHISQNHPFVDGNKRTGLALALVFLEINGISVSDPGGRLYQAVMNVSLAKLDKFGFADILRPLSEG